MAKPNLTIDRELQHILPPLTDEELRLLEDAIKQDGCEVPIIYWENAPKDETPIIDGMNRFYICQRLKLSYPVMGKKFPDRTAVIRWMRIRQLARRNLTDAARTVLRGQLYRELKGSPGEPSKKGTMGQNVPIPQTASELAESEGVDRKTLQRAEKTADAVDAIKEKSPVVAAAIMSEAIPINAAQALADATKAELKQVAAAVKTGDKKAVREAVKDVIAPEPSTNGDGAPWEANDEEDDGLVVEFLTACNTDKIKATKAQREKFAEFDEDSQRAFVIAIVNGWQSLSNALSTGEVAEPPIEEKIKEHNAAVDADCRAMRKALAEFVTLFENTMDKPHHNGPWAKDLKRRNAAIDKFKAAIQVEKFEDVLETIRSWKVSKPCPMCKGEGCKDCHNTSMVTTQAYQQLVG